MHQNGGTRDLAAHAQALKWEMDRRKLVRGGAGLTAGASVSPPLSEAFKPGAVIAAQRVLQETGDSAEAAVAAARLKTRSLRSCRAVRRSGSYPALSAQCLPFAFCLLPFAPPDA
jgi:hypothetical protein